MQLLKSLFCLQGFDNRTRFSAICSAVFITFIVLASTALTNLVVAVIVVLLFTSLLALTSLRRLNDARLNKRWLFIPSICFAITALIIALSQQSASYLLLLIPALCCGVLLTYPSKVQNGNTSYILGYIGPVDLSEYQESAYQGKTAKFRIEPSLAGEQSVNIDLQEQQILEASAAQNTGQTSQLNENTVDIGEIIRLKLLSNKKAQIAIIAVISLVLLSVFISWLITFFNANNASEVIPEPIQEKHLAQQQALLREHPLEMPDNFTLFLSEHQGVIINWQADEVTESQLWSQQTTLGDESCKEISFNKGKPIRTLTVDVETLAGQHNNYFASFSPLDSPALVQALAFRGTFTLCGYDFSLKGSQAALGKNKFYADWVNY